MAGKAKKAAKKPVSEEQKGLLEEEVDLGIESLFAVVHLLMKEDRRWRLKLKIKTILPKSYYNYGVRLLVDEEPFERRIEHIEEKIADAKANPSLLDQLSNRRLNDYDDDIIKVRKELLDLKKRCPVMDFFATVNEVKYKDGDTVVEFNIPHDVIASLNEQRDMLTYYKVRLEPKF